MFGEVSCMCLSIFWLGVLLWEGQDINLSFLIHKKCFISLLFAMNSTWGGLLRFWICFVSYLKLISISVLLGIKVVKIGGRAYISLSSYACNFGIIHFTPKRGCRSFINKHGSFFYRMGSYFSSHIVSWVICTRPRELVWLGFWKCTMFGYVMVEVKPLT